MTIFEIYGTQSIRKGMFSMIEFDIREYDDILETINLIVRGGGIAEVKIEKRSVPTVVEIKRTKRFPPKE